jgi:tetratricopeptide (TPR) repeat protein
MANDDWYRNTEWNERISKAFFDRLARARSQRDQYLVIQALTLSSCFPKAAIELVDTYFETRKDDFDDVRALLAKAEAYRALGELPEAIQAYKDTMAREAEFPSHRTRTYLDLPYLIASEGIRGEYEFALKLLSKGLDDLAFPVDMFLWRAANALIADDLGQTDLAIDHAKRAIEIAEVKKSGFRYHQNVGLVGKEHEKVLKRLVALAA